MTCFPLSRLDVRERSLPVYLYPLPNQGFSQLSPLLVVLPSQSPRSCRGLALFLSLLRNHVRYLRKRFPSSPMNPKLFPSVFLYDNEEESPTFPESAYSRSGPERKLFASLPFPSLRSHSPPPFRLWHTLDRETLIDLFSVSPGPRPVTNCLHFLLGYLQVRPELSTPRFSPS